MSDEELKTIDDILSAYNISRTGEDIRRELLAAGFVVGRQYVPMVAVLPANFKFDLRPGAINRVDGC